MIHVPAPDPFAVFGLPRTLDLDERKLEKRYLALSRDCHPDRNRAADTADCAAVLQRAAEINDAFSILRDPWQRAKALIEAESRGALRAHQKLDATFLADALELAEEVAFASGKAIPALRDRLAEALAGDYEALQRAVAARDFGAAAKRFHEAHYHRKALSDLEHKS